MPTGWKPRLSPDSQADLKVVEAMNVKTTLENKPSEVQQDFGTPLDSTPVKPEAETKDPLENQTYSGTAFDNIEFRRDVESRSQDIDFGRIGETGRFYQSVPAFPDKLEIVFRTQCGEESIRIAKAASNSEFTENNLSTRLFEIRSEDLAACIESLSGSWVSGGSKTFPDPLKTSTGSRCKWDEKVYEANLLAIKELPTPIILRLIPQCLWFLSRIDREMSPMALKKD